MYSTPNRGHSGSDSDSSSSEDYEIQVPTLRPVIDWSSNTKPSSTMPTTNPPTPTVTAKTMPSKNHSSAPKFDGKASNLSLFLDEVETLAATCSLTPKQTIEWAIRYSPTESYELWSSLDAAKGNDWDAFKTELCSFYPGSSGDRRYSVANLEMVVEKQAGTPITTAEQFGAYYRSFNTMSRYLLAKNRLTSREVSSLFIRGFDFAFRTQVRAQLRAENPTHHTDDPFTLKQISDAALFILSCNSEDTGVDPIVATAEPSIKREVFDVSNMGNVYQASNFNINALASEIIKQLNLQQGSVFNVGQSAAISRPASNINTQPRFRSNECAFCSDLSHYQSSCPKATEYIQKGHCIRNNENFIVLPNGLRVTPRIASGRNIMERIDAWHRANPTNITTVSSNFVGIGTEYISEPEGSNWAMPSTVTFAGLNDNEEQTLTVREQEELETLEALIASTQKKVDETKKRAQATKPNTGPTTRNMSKKNPLEDKSKPAVPQPNQPQYKYSTPIEDTKLVNSVLDRALDVPITITNRELLALAPDVRRQVKDLITTKRTPTNGNPLVMTQSNVQSNVDVLIASLPVRDDGLIVAKHTEELCAIDVVVDGNITVEGICDDGSQIVGIRKDIWEKLGLPVRSDHVMVIESAHKTKENTIGLLQDLKITIGGYDFYVQAQVVENAPYEMLLGLPLLNYTSSSIQHQTNGLAHLTLNDPNTGATITVPTRPRNRRLNKDKDTSTSATVGF